MAGRWRNVGDPPPAVPDDGPGNVIVGRADAAGTPSPPHSSDGLRNGLWRDGVVAAGFVSFTIWLYKGLWFDLDRCYLWNGVADQSQWEWYATVVATSVAHGDEPAGNRPAELSRWSESRG